MPNLAANKSAIREAVKGLLQFIDDNSDIVDGLVDHFPAPEEILRMPAVSIDAKTPKFIPLTPYVLTKGEPENVASESEDEDRKALVTRVYGMYDFEFQMDLWTAYKPQRDSLVEEIHRIFNLNSDCHGVNLQLSNYFDQYCHFSIGDIRHEQNEAGSQRGEWRAMVTVLGNIRCVNQILANVMEEIENTLETPGSIPADEEDASELTI